MFRIRYARRVVTDARPKDDPDNVFVAAEIPETFAEFERIEDAYRQAISDLHHGKIVLGVEDEKGHVEFDAKALHVGLAKARKQMEAHQEGGRGPKAARQLTMRDLTP
jgi:hypothetical protein